MKSLFTIFFALIAMVISLVTILEMHHYKNTAIDTAIANKSKHYVIQTDPEAIAISLNFLKKLS